MPENNPIPTEVPPGQKDDLRQTLDRIAAALEKRNELAGKNGGDEAGDKGQGGQEGGDKEKKDEKGQGEGGEQGKKDGQEGEGDDQKKEGDEKKKKAKRFFLSPLGIILIVVVLAGLIIAGLTIWHYEKNHVSTDDAYTTAHVHQVSPRVAGTVMEVWVDDNQIVTTGDLLVKLDTRDYDVACLRAQASLDQATANVIQAQAAIVQAGAGIEQAQAQVAQARAQTTQAGAQYQVAGVNYGRNSALFTKDSRAVAQADVDTTKSNLDATKGGFEAAKASTQAAEAAASSAKSMKESREAELVVAQAQVETAQAGVDDAKLQLSYCWVLAPCDGRVSRKTVETGQRLSPGQALLAVTENDVWVLANLKETQLQHVRVGQRVKVPVDAFPGHPFTGRVDSIQAGSGATYSLLPPDNATGNFTKIVQRVPVKITFDRGDGEGSLKGFENLVVAGLSTEPVIDLQSTSDRGDHVTKGNQAPPKGKKEQ